MLNFEIGAAVCLRNCPSLWIMEARWTGQWFINITSPAFPQLHAPFQAIQLVGFLSLYFFMAYLSYSTNKFMLLENSYSRSCCWNAKYFFTIVVWTFFSFSEPQWFVLLLWLLCHLLPSITRSWWKLEAVLGLGSGMWALYCCDG